MGVKKISEYENRLKSAVSIPFSSGHGGKVDWFLATGGEEELFLSLFHQVMGVKVFRSPCGAIGTAVSIPFSSGHGGKGQRKDEL